MGMHDTGGEQRALTLAGTPESPRSARRFVRTAVLDWGLDEVADDAALLTSELATNAVLHARSAFEVVVERHDASVRVTVLDDSAAGPVRRHNSLRSGTGRGIALVETLAVSWGRTDAEWLGERAKGVWFELAAGPQARGGEGSMYGATWPLHQDD